MTDENNMEPIAEDHNVPQELDGVRDLVNRYGQPILIGLLVVLALTIGFRVYQHRKLAETQEALVELSSARATPDLQSWVERFPKVDVAPLARLRLASSLYSDGLFSQAISEYETFLTKYPNHMFAPAAELGKCHALEASGQVGAALAGFEAFISAHSDYFLQPEAIMGKARCLAQQKRYDDARIACEDLMASKPDSEWSMRAEQTLRSVNRMEKGIVPTPAAARTWTIPEAAVSAPQVIDIPEMVPTATATNAEPDTASGTNQPPLSE